MNQATAIPARRRIARAGILLLTARVLTSTWNRGDGRRTGRVPFYLI